MEPAPVFLPGEFQWSLVGYSPQRHKESDMAEVTQHTHMYVYRRRQWQPTTVLLPGKSHGQRSLVGCHLWVHTESDVTEVTQQQQHVYIYMYIYTFPPPRLFSGFVVQRGSLQLFSTHCSSGGIQIGERLCLPPWKPKRPWILSFVGRAWTVIRTLASR